MKNKVSKPIRRSYHSSRDFILCGAIWVIENDWKKFSPPHPEILQKLYKTCLCLWQIEVTSAYFRLWKDEIKRSSNSVLLHVVTISIGLNLARLFLAWSALQRKRVWWKKMILRMSKTRRNFVLFWVSGQWRGKDFFKKILGMFISQLWFCPFSLFRRLKVLNFITREHLVYRHSFV